MSKLYMPGSQWLESKGRIIYDPVRPGLKKKTDWWCILTADTEITRYYRWWVDKELMNPIDLPKQGLCNPAWDAHISIIRGEKPRPEVMHLWKKYQGEEVTYRYRPIVKYNTNPKNEANGLYWFIDIDCPKLTEIRKEFGFAHHWSLHLTVGRQYLKD